MGREEGIAARHHGGSQLEAGPCSRIGHLLVGITEGVGQMAHLLLRQPLFQHVAGHAHLGFQVGSVTVVAFTGAPFDAYVLPVAGAPRT